MNRSVLLLLLLTSLNTFAQSPLKPSVQRIQNMDFGVISVGAQGGNLILTSEGSRILQGDLGPGRGAFQPALFQITGSPNAPFSIRVIPAPVPLPPSAGKARIQDFKAQHSIQGRLDAWGRAQLPLGATMVIDPGVQGGLHHQDNVQLLVDMPGFGTFSDWFEVRCYFNPRLTVEVLHDLDFGDIQTGPSQGRVILAPNGDCRFPDSQGPRAAAKNAHPAELLITGAQGQKFTVVLPQQVLLQGPGKPLLANTFQSTVSCGTLSGYSCRVGIGATLLVPKSQVMGRYSGVFEVCVNYN